MSFSLEELFSGIEPDVSVVERMMRLPEPKISYVIYFTPRSGSSWLTDILATTQRLGRANELFNPHFIPNIAKACNAASLTDYINLTKRRLQTQGAFSFEITYHQLRTVFPDPGTFEENYGDLPSFWLIRENIVEQAVSLAKMVATQVAHTASASDESRVAAEQRFKYDPEQIKRWLIHILAAERANEDYFNRFEISPFRMSYEQTTRLGAEAVVKLIANRVGVYDLPDIALESQHGKLGTQLNSNYAQRFVEDERLFLATVEEERAEWLEKLTDLSTYA